MHGNSQAIIVAGMGFGDEGKGTIVDSLVRQTGAHTVVRYNGGPQAGHTVVTEDGRHHTFAQFGAGTFAGARTFLSRHMCVAPMAALKEAEALRGAGIIDPLSLLAIDEHALVITPFHRAANRLRELSRGGARHGSCGVGVGESMADLVFYGPDQAVFAADLVNPAVLSRKLARIQELKRAELSAVAAHLPAIAEVEEERAVLERPDAPAVATRRFNAFGRAASIVSSRHFRALLAKPGSVVFEGAQGALLDEWYGFHPYTTWSTTTPKNARALLADAGYQGSVVTVGVTRSYGTRHGAGPFPTESARLTRALPDRYNGFGAWQGGFRVGEFDMVLARYAAEVAGGVDLLALTHADAIGRVPLRAAYGYAVDERDHGLFELNSERVAARIIPKRALEDLGYQERLTTALVRAIPQYLPEHLSAEALCAAAAEAFKAPVGIISAGSRASNKQYLPEARRQVRSLVSSLMPAA